MLLPKAAHGACEQLYLGGTPGQRILAHGGHPVGVQSIGHFHPGGNICVCQRHTLPCGQSLCLPYGSQHGVPRRPRVLYAPVRHIVNRAYLVQPHIEHQLAPLAVQNIFMYFAGHARLQQQCGRRVHSRGARARTAADKKLSHIAVGDGGAVLYGVHPLGHTVKHVLRPVGCGQLALAGNAVEQGDDQCFRPDERAHRFNGGGKPGTFDGEDRQRGRQRLLRCHKAEGTGSAVAGEALCRITGCTLCIRSKEYTLRAKCLRHALAEHDAQRACADDCDDRLFFHNTFPPGAFGAL